MDKCFYCNNLIEGEYYVDWKGNAICHKHNEILLCDSCGCFIKSTNCEEVESGRYICNDCLQNEVTRDNFGWIKKQVMLRLYNVGFQDIQCDWVNFRIISQKQMKEDAGEAATGYHTGINIIDETICVLSHINKISIAETLAHELLHAWQMQNNLTEYNEYGVDDNSKKVCEGFAQMGSWLILDTIDHPYAKWRKDMMFKSEDEVYGIPFQKIYDRYKVIGWLGIIREARQHKLKV